MASSKTLMLLGLLVAIFLISAEVSARDLGETAQTQESMQLDGYHHHHHYGHGGHHGGHHGDSVHEEYEGGHGHGEHN